MKQLLQKMFELLRQVASLLAGLIRPLVTLLRTVNVGQPRGVMLCVGLQALILFSLALALHRTAPRLAPSPTDTENRPAAPAAEIDPALR